MPVDTPQRRKYYRAYRGHGGAAVVSTDLSAQALTKALAGRLVGSQVHYYDLLSSTMDEAKRLADDGCPEGAVVVADVQTAGRGRFSRSWISPPGENLSFSVVLRPTASQLSYVNMAATLAVSGAVAHMTGLTPSIKWPNDVRLCGLKIAGILVETAVAAGQTRHAAVGIGLNVNLDPSQFPEIAATATSLRREAGRRLDRATVLLAVLERLDTLYAQIRRGESLTERWSAGLDTLGRVVQVRWGDRLLKGRATAVDEQGNLLLAQPDGSTVRVVAGEVTLQD